MTSATIKALKAYAADLTEFDFKTLQAHLKNESDRAAIIMLCAFLEDKLERALRAKIEASKSKASIEPGK